MKLRYVANLRDASHFQVLPGNVPSLIQNPTGVLLGSPESTVRRKTVTAARPWHTVWLANFPLIKGYWGSRRKKWEQGAKQEGQKGTEERGELSIAKHAEVQNWRGGKAEFMLSATGHQGQRVPACVTENEDTDTTLHAASALRGTFSLHIPVFNMQKIKKMNKWMHWSDPITFSQSFKGQLVTLSVCQSTLHSCSH